MSSLPGKGTLSGLQKNLLFEFGRIPDSSSFYLAGGTALSEFYLGHRRSYDLDFFTGEKDLIIPFTRAAEESLIRKRYTAKVSRRFETFVEMEVSQENENLILHFAYDSPFRLEAPALSEYGVKVNSYRDLSVDKLLTFFGRWKHRDAIDLYFILKAESIDGLLKLAGEKDPGFDLYWFCVALKEVDSFPDEIEKWPVDMLVKVNAVELKNNFSRLAREILDRIKTAKGKTNSV